MENEEMMNYEEMDPEVEVTDVESEESGMGTGMGTGIAMLIGAGLTLAIGAAVKLGKKAYAKFKAKKEEAATADDHDFVIPSDEEIKNVTK